MLNSSEADGHVLFSPAGLSQADYFPSETDLDLIIEMAQSVFVDEDVIPIFPIVAPVAPVDKPVRKRTDQLKGGKNERKYVYETKSDATKEQHRAHAKKQVRDQKGRTKKRYVEKEVKKKKSLRQETVYMLVYKKE
jgi:hypothetical protein